MINALSIRMECGAIIFLSKRPKEEIMKRYGDNLPASSHAEQEFQYGGPERVMYGGCGIRFGTFVRYIPPPKRKKAFDFFSLLRWGRTKVKHLLRT
jgi:hypothetical protein